MKYITILILLIFMTGCTSIGKKNHALTSFPVASFVNVDVLDAKKKLDKIADASLSPYELILKMMHVGSEQMELVIRQVYSNIEDKSEVSVTVVQEGYLDDSIRGEWKEFKLKLNKNNEWEIVNAKEAYLCRRQKPKEYQREYCQ